MKKDLVLPLPNELMVVFGPHSGTAMMLDLAARLSLRGQLYILDCGNRSNMYRVARALRPLTRDPAAMLKHIHLSRAFTCYQALSLLEKTEPTAGTPVLVLDLLATFLDESVQLEESAFLFKKAMARVLAIRQFSPVIVSAKPLLSISSPRMALLDQLKEQSDQLWEEMALYPGVPARSPQLSLFDGS